MSTYTNPVDFAQCANRGLSGKPYANPLKPLIPEGWSAASKPLRQVVFNKISGKICFLKIRKVLINNIIY
jgi:hypothetical protein